MGLRDRALAVLAFAVLAMPAPAAWSQARWITLAGPGTGVAALPASGDCRLLDGDLPGLLAVPDGHVALCWDPMVRLEPGWRRLLRQGCAWLSLLRQRASADAEIAAAAAALR